MRIIKLSGSKCHEEIRGLRTDPWGTSNLSEQVRETPSTVLDKSRSVGHIVFSAQEHSASDAMFVFKACASAANYRLSGDELRRQKILLLRICIPQKSCKKDNVQYQSSGNSGGILPPCRLASDSGDSELDLQLHCSSGLEEEPETVVLQAESPPLASVFDLTTSFEEDVLDLKWRQSIRATLLTLSLTPPALSRIILCCYFVCFFCLLLFCIFHRIDFFNTLCLNLCVCWTRPVRWDPADASACFSPAGTTPLPKITPQAVRNKCLFCPAANTLKSAASVSTTMCFCSKVSQRQVDHRPPTQ